MKGRVIYSEIILCSFIKMPKRKPGQKPPPRRLPKPDDGYPRMNILTPIYNRTKWLPLMIANIVTFDYDKEKLTWYILDSKDGDEDIRLFPDDESIESVRRAIHPVKLVYEYWGKKMTIAEKRNYLCKHSTTEWWANLDSDDIYMEQYLKYSYDLAKKEKVQLVGSPEMIFIYPHYDFKVTAIRCEAARQIHEATMVGTKKYVRSMGGFTKRQEKGEGASLIDGNEMNVRKSECANCMICVCHNTNTCSKEMFKETNIQDVKVEGSKIDVLKVIMKDELEEGFVDASPFKCSDGVKDLPEGIPPPQVQAQAPQVETEEIPTPDLNQ